MVDILANIVPSNVDLTKPQVLSPPLTPNAYFEGCVHEALVMRLKSSSRCFRTSILSVSHYLQICFHCVSRYCETRNDAIDHWPSFVAFEYSLNAVHDPTSYQPLKNLRPDFVHSASRAYLHPAATGNGNY